MPRRPAAVTETEIVRALRAAKRAGASFVRVMPGGGIEVDLRPAAEPLGADARAPTEPDVFET